MIYINCLTTGGKGFALKAFENPQDASIHYSNELTALSKRGFKLPKEPILVTSQKNPHYKYLVTRLKSPFKDLTLASYKTFQKSPIIYYVAAMEYDPKDYGKKRKKRIWKFKTSPTQANARERMDQLKEEFDAKYGKCKIGRKQLNSKINRCVSFYYKNGTTLQYGVLYAQKHQETPQPELEPEM